MLPVEVDGSERITRFARHSSQFSEATRRVRHNLFMPPSNLRLSVFRTSDMPEDDAWSLGDTIVLRGTGQVRARADFDAERIRAVKLEIEPEPTPHPRHADIVGWPADKAERLYAAKELAASALLVLRESP